jgi:hypothetical protein
VSVENGGKMEKKVEKKGRQSADDRNLVHHVLQARLAETVKASLGLKG